MSPKDWSFRSALKALALFGLVLGIWWFGYAESRSVLLHDLKLIELPKSVHAVSCTSGFTTDVLTDCDFEVDSVEFELLLKGRKYYPPSQGVVGSQTSGWSGNAPFVVTQTYMAQTDGDPEFPHGGGFYIYVNSDRTKGRTFLYVE
jgi:hypothetical protein